MTKPKHTQKYLIAKHLISGRSITPLRALNRFGCFRLADVIYKLRRRGWDIETRITAREGKQYASYRLKNFYPNMMEGIPR